MQAGVGQVDVIADDGLELGVGGAEITLAVPERVVAVEAHQAKTHVRGTHSVTGWSSVGSLPPMMTLPMRIW